MNQAFDPDDVEEQLDPTIDSRRSAPAPLESE
jgi:hypothetical protein